MNKTAGERQVVYRTVKSPSGKKQHISMTVWEMPSGFYSAHINMSLNSFGWGHYYEEDFRNAKIAVDTIEKEACSTLQEVKREGYPLVGEDKYLVERFFAGDDSAQEISVALWCLILPV